MRQPWLFFITYQSALAQAAVHRKNLASDEWRSGQKEDDGVGDLSGSAGAFGRSVSDHVLVATVEVVEGDDTGGNGVHGDRWGKGFGERFGQHDDAGFGCAVVRMFGPWPNTAE